MGFKKPPTTDRPLLFAELDCLNGVLALGWQAPDTVRHIRSGQPGPAHPFSTNHDTNASTVLQCCSVAVLYVECCVHSGPVRRLTVADNVDGPLRLATRQRSRQEVAASARPSQRRR